MVSCGSTVAGFLVESEQPFTTRKTLRSKKLDNDVPIIFFILIVGLKTIFYLNIPCYYAWPKFLCRFFTNGINRKDKRLETKDKRQKIKDKRLKTASGGDDEKRRSHPDRAFSIVLPRRGYWNVIRNWRYTYN